MAKVREILKSKTRDKVIALARKNGWEVRESGRVVWIDDAKCTFDAKNKLLMVE
jgi:branched-subunit amino acid aminotransferase/4-amino-4-deoxychorismate lyase